MQTRDSGVAAIFGRCQSNKYARIGSIGCARVTGSAKKKNERKEQFVILMANSL